MRFGQLEQRVASSGGVSPSSGERALGGVDGEQEGEDSEASVKKVAELQEQIDALTADATELKEGVHSSHDRIAELELEVRTGASMCA